MFIKRYGLKAFHIFLFAILIGALTPAEAMADEKVSSLTPENVKDFIKKTSEITAGQNLEMDSEEVAEYLDRHLHKDARFKSNLQYNIPGHPVQETALALNKNDFIDSVKSGAQAIKDYENDIKVKTIKISKDQTKATVKTSGFETGMMPVSAAEGGTKLIPIEGTSDCDQIIMIGDDGYIQMYTANCKTVISFRNF